MPPTASRLYDPAKDAARLLGWFGLATLMVGAPVVNVLSRQALFIVLPVGAAILAAAYFLSVSRSGLHTLRAALATPIGLAGLLLAGWPGLSMAWTPFPELVVPRYLATLATSTVAALVVAHLPEGRVTRNMFLLPAGIAIAALATAALALVGPASFRGGSEFDPSLLERSAVTLSLLVWPALGALAAFERWWLAIVVAVLVAAAMAAASASLALVAFAIAAVVFAASCEGGAGRTSTVLAAALIGLVLFAPALPFALAPAAEAVPAIGRSTVAAMMDWRDLVAVEPIRLVTGHGLDSARAGVVAGFLPPHTPRSILFELWYDLGMVGAVAFAAAFGLGLLAAGQAAASVAPALLGGLVATLLVALFGIATTELWFVTLIAVQAVALGLLARSSRAQRPAVTATRTP